MLQLTRLLREQGLDKSDLAGVVVKNRAHGALNPDAMFRTAVTAEEVLASRVVCEPLHLWMLCSPNEGAAAVVLRRPATPESLLQALRGRLAGFKLPRALHLIDRLPETPAGKPDRRALRRRFEPVDG